MKSRLSPVWTPTFNRQNFFKPIDFFARRIHFIDHLAPIWNNIPVTMRGTFYVPISLKDYTRGLGIQEVTGLAPFQRTSRDPAKITPDGDGPLVTCAYGDTKMGIRKNPKRPQILMEHGVGLSFPEHAPGYAGGGGIRCNVCLFLAPNEVIRKKTAKTFPGAFQIVVGTPKMDKWADIPKKVQDDPPTIAVAFHWDGKRVCPEAGNAWEYYKGVLPSLTKHYHVLGHGHPKIIDKLAPLYKGMGIEVVTSFEEVLARADIYLNDSSSTLYEFACVDRPVVILNAPWFRKTVDFGIRWWDYTDIGPQCERPQDLRGCIERALKDRTHFAEPRKRAVKELYPFLGSSAQVAARAIINFVKGVQCGDIKPPTKD